jgi:hypothetical protein
MTFDNKNIPKYLLMLGIIIFASYLGKTYSKYIEGDENKNEYKLIQEYLLNDSPLYGYNKPKLWIHTKYEYNARKWKSFQSRSSYDLNQPYIHLTIKSIVLHCADDFNICLIDDDTFSKLIPSWSIDMKSTPEPLKTRYRDYGIAQLLYYYGGVVVPNTFICRRNLKDLWIEGTEGGTPFIGEYQNRFANSTAGGQQLSFIGNIEYINGPTGLLDGAKRDLQLQSHNSTLKKSRQMLTFLPNPFFMGARKNDPVMLELVEYLKIRDSRIPFSGEALILGSYSQLCLTKVLEGKMLLIDGEMLGTKTVIDKKPVLIEDLIEEGYLDIRHDSYGVYIPEEDLLKRNKYQWFTVMSTEEILQSRMALSKYLVESIVNYLPNNRFSIMDDNNIENKMKNIKITDKTVFSI